MVTDSFRHRYLAKLVANIIILIVNLLSQSIATRGLGPKSYGDFSFLSSFYTQLMPFLSFSTASGFYAKISRRQAETQLYVFYAFFTLISFILLLGFTVYLSQWPELAESILPDHAI